MTIETKEGEVKLDKVSELANERMASLEKAESEKAKAEKEAQAQAKGDASGKSSTEKEKTEGDKEGVSDEKLLESEDKDLSEEDKKRKEVLVQEKEDAKTPEEKQKDWQENVNKRIGELTGALKAEKNGRSKDASTIKSLEQTIADLKGALEDTGTIDSEDVALVKSEEELYSKMVSEDAELPRIQRREMSEEELEEFLLEDYSKANQWIVRRELRRDKELEAKKASNQASKDVVHNIQEAADKLFEKYPDCNQEERGKALMKEGKTESEAMEIIMKESPDFAIMMEIMKEKPDLADPNNVQAPIQLMEAIEKKKSESSSEGQKEKPKMYTEEDMKKAQEDAAMKERDRISSIDVGLTSSETGTPSARSSDPMYKKGLDIFIKAGARKGQSWTEKDYIETLDYGNKQRQMSPL